MESQSLLTHSKTAPLCVGFSGFGTLSFRHFNKHLRFTPTNHARCSLPTLNPIRTYSIRSFSENPLSKSSKTTGTKFFPTPNSSAFDAASPEPDTPFLKPLKNLSLHSLKASLLKITPYDVVKFSTVSSLVIAAAKWTANGLFNPFFWMYFSWSWVFWPWIVAVAVAGYGIYCHRKHSRGEASMFEQLAVVTSAFAWLTLVPPAHFNGFLQGWPYVFFFVYHYFFFFNVTVRKRLYGDYYLRPHDPKWDSTVPEWKTYLFSGGVFAGHWLAALEGPELHRISGGLVINSAMWALIIATLLMQYNSTLYLANYSEKVVVPTAVVQFGPYRWVRHPIYASTMLLFATYCAALRSPFSMLFIVGVCVWYYDQKAKLEEALMVESFGDGYFEYADRVKYKFIPFVY